MNREQILNRWAAGEGAGMIAKSLGIVRTSVHRHIHLARKRGDPRAISHADYAAGTDGWRRRYVRQGNEWAII